MSANSQSTDLVPLSEYLDVRVTDQEKRNDNFIMFIVETRSEKSRLPPQLLASLGCHLLQTFRRYSDFYLLREFLEMSYPSCIVPPLPDKLSSYVPWKIASQKFDPDFLENRRLGLEIFLLRLLKHPKLSQCEQVTLFLKEDNSWKELISSQHFSQSLQSYVEVHSATFRLRKNLDLVTELKVRATSLKVAVGAVIKAYEKVVKRHFLLHKLHGHYGNIFSEWCVLEDGASADSIQAVGHFMDVYCTSLDSTLGEDDEMLNQLRVYHLYGDVLLALCRRVELKVLHIEQIEDKMIARQNAIQQIEDGNYGVSLKGLKTKLFGAPTNAEKAAHTLTLQDEIRTLESQLSDRQDELKEFCSDIDQELKLFEMQKKKDIASVMRYMSSLQLAKIKRSHKVWNHCKDNFSKY